MPRGLDFLFNANRLNVAVSRAQCLAVLVHSPRLLDADCDPIAVDEALGEDPVLAPLVADLPGLRVPGHRRPRRT